MRNREYLQSLLLFVALTCFLANSIRADIISDNRLYIDDITLEPGMTKEVPVMLKNSNEVKAVQGNIKLPNGFKFGTKSNGRLDVANINQRSEDFTLSCALQENGSMTFAHYSSDGYAYEGSSGGIFTFKIVVDENVTSGNYDISLTDVTISINGVGYDMPSSGSKIAIKGTTNGIPINVTNFPDANFRNYLLDQDFGHDAMLTEQEIEYITKIDVSDMNIYSLKGIEFFTSLEILNCSNNHLTALDMSNNGSLKELIFFRNYLNGPAMDELISSLRTNNTGDEHHLDVINILADTKDNLMTEEQAKAARAKGWQPFFRWNSSGWVPYYGRKTGNVVSGTKLITNVSQLSSPYTETFEGSLAGLIDDDIYTFWHSMWTAGFVTNGTHYLQAEVPEMARNSLICMQFTRRNTYSDHTTIWGVYGTNDYNATKNECNKLTEISSPYKFPDCWQETFVSEPFSNKDYKYLRFYAEQEYSAVVNDGEGFFHLAEFQLFYLQSEIVPVTNISLNKTSETMPVGTNLQLIATVTPTNATDKSVSWKSSNESVATVNASGLVNARAVGNVIITCTANDGSGVKATCQFTIEKTQNEIAINTSNFPDANFRSYLLAQSFGQDGKLSELEISSITSIDVHEMNITSLKGIEIFTNLNLLNCNDNLLTSLDILIISPLGYHPYRC